MSSSDFQRIHATAVAWQGLGALLMGPSGSGKSSVALQMLGLGCDLVADDQCEIHRTGSQLIVSCPEPIKGQIEARHFGILNCASVSQARLICAVDMSRTEEKRLPDEQHISICDTNIRLFHKCGIEGLPFALLQYLKGYQITQSMNESETNDR